DFLVVMHFHDFDVELLVESTSDALDQCRKQIHAHAHVAGFDNDRALGRLGDQLFILPREPRGADDVNASLARGNLGKPDGGGGDRKVEKTIRGGKPRLERSCNRYAVLPKPREFTGIAADHRRAARFDRAGKRYPFGCGDGVNERATHASARSGHDQPHVGHRLSPAFRLSFRGAVKAASPESITTDWVM